MKRRVKISPLFLLPCGILWYSLGWIWAAGYMGAVLFHELSHMYIAGLVGVEKGTLCLDFYGCKAELEGLDCCEISRELPIALAGPLFNLMSAVVLGLLSQLLYFWYYPLMDFAVCNLFLGGFNLLPLLPLDGGRVLRSILCAFLPRAKGTKICVNISLFFGSGMIAAFAYYAYFGRYKIFLAVIGLVIVLGAISEQKRVSRYRLGVMSNDNKLASPKRVKRYAVSCEDDLKSALSYFRDDCFNIVDVVTKDGKVQKTMTEVELMRELLK